MVYVPKATLRACQSMLLNAARSAGKHANYEALLRRVADVSQGRAYACPNHPRMPCPPPDLNHHAALGSELSSLIPMRECAQPEST